MLAAEASPHQRRVSLPQVHPALRAINIAHHLLHRLHVQAKHYGQSIIMMYSLDVVYCNNIFAFVIALSLNYTVTYYTISSLAAQTGNTGVVSELFVMFVIVI